MTAQLDLDFNAGHEDIIRRTDDLVAALRGRGWVTARELRSVGFTDRELRDIVEHDSTGQILSYPGSPGYRLFDEATLDEIARARTLRSQARAMLNRFLRYQRRGHSRL